MDRTVLSLSAAIVCGSALACIGCQGQSAPPSSAATPATSAPVESMASPRTSPGRVVPTALVERADTRGESPEDSDGMLPRVQSPIGDATVSFGKDSRPSQLQIVPRGNKSTASEQPTRLSLDNKPVLKIKSAATPDSAARPESVKVAERSATSEVKFSAGKSPDAAIVWRPQAEQPVAQGPAQISSPATDEAPVSRLVKRDKETVASPAEQEPTPSTRIAEGVIERKLNVSAKDPVAAAPPVVAETSPPTIPAPANEVPQVVAAPVMTPPAEVVAKAPPASVPEVVTPRHETALVIKPETPARKPEVARVETPAVEAPKIAATPEPEVSHDEPVESRLVSREPQPHAVMPAEPWQDAQPQEPEESAPVISSMPPVHTPLPWANATIDNPEMLAIARRADGRVRHGFTLAQRGAIYSAKAEFTAALKLIAEANDAQQNTRLYSKAAAAGFLALKESADFSRQTASIGYVDVGSIIASHKTPILKDVETSQMAPMVAAARYHAYAQEQLAAAAGQQVAGSMALYGLGKIAMASIGGHAQRMEFVGQAIALHEAALIAEPKNFRAANELGVLLADNGQLEQAQEMLAKSAAISGQTPISKNLSQVNRRLNDNKLADVGAKKKPAGGPANNAPDVKWVDAATFARTASATDNVVPPTPATPPAPAPAKQPAKETKPPATAKKGLSDWLNLRR